MEEKINGKINFSVFISGLMAEGLIALGLMKNPINQELKKDLTHAIMVIDTLSLLKEKTAGNLAKEEADMLDESIHQLRMVYMAEKDKVEKGGNAGTKSENEK